MSSFRRSGCRVGAQDAQSSLQELDLNFTARSAGQGWSSSCVEMPREETALRKVEDGVQAPPETERDV